MVIALLIQQTDYFSFGPISALRKYLGMVWDALPFISMDEFESDLAFFTLICQHSSTFAALDTSTGSHFTPAQHKPLVCNTELTLFQVIGSGDKNHC